MRRFKSLSLALASVAAASVALQAARPKFGGVLRVEAEGTFRSLTVEPPAANVADVSAWTRIRPLVYETLVSIDADGLHPQLATAWERAADGARWRFQLRAGVTLHNGSLLEPWQVVAALRSEAEVNAWQVRADGDAIVVTSDRPVPDLPWLLANPRDAIAVQTSSGEAVGTGPFRVDRFDGSVLTLRAHDDYRDGRPFLDGVRIETARPLGGQLTDLENGRADMIGLSPLSAHRVEQRGLQVSGSRPLELLALIFEPHRSGDDLVAWRRTIAGSLDRAAIGSVLLQQRAEPAQALLPAWLSGYPAFDATNAGTRLTAAQVAALPLDQRSPAIRVNPSDPLVRAVAERMAVDARAAGFSIAVQAPSGLAPRADARLVRVPLVATTPDRAFADLVARLAPRAAAPVPAPGAPLDAVYRAEQSLLDASVVVPVVYLPELYGFAERLHSSPAPLVRSAGAWNLADAWLELDKR